MDGGTTTTTDGYIHLAGSSGLTAATRLAHHTQAETELIIIDEIEEEENYFMEYLVAEFPDIIFKIPSPLENLSILYKQSINEIYEPKPRFNRRPMFCKSGYLPKRIRRKRK